MVCVSNYLYYKTFMTRNQCHLYLLHDFHHQVLICVGCRPVQLVLFDGYLCVYL